MTRRHKEVGTQTPITQTIEAKPRTGHPAIMQTVERTVCPICRSDKREKYHNTVRQECSGVDLDGVVYIAVEWRRTVCLNCGQHRVDRSFVRPLSTPPA